MSRPMGVPNGATRQAVLDYLVHEADLDGLVTVSQQEIGAVLGISAMAASLHIAALAGEGLIADAGRVQGVKSHAIKAWQLAESVMA